MSKHPNLTKYIERKDFWRKRQGKPGYDANNREDCQSLANSIGCDLSPENLHCDGEISAAEARKRYKFFMACLAEIKALHPSIKMPSEMSMY